MPRLENVLKPFHDDALGKLPLSAGEGGIEPPTKFKKRDIQNLSF